MQHSFWHHKASDLWHRFLISAKESCKIGSCILACTSAGCYAAHVLLLTSGCTGEAREEISPVSLLCLRQGKHMLCPGRVTDPLFLWSAPPRGQLFTHTGSPTSHFLGRCLSSVTLPPSLERGICFAGPSFRHSSLKWTEGKEQRDAFQKVQLDYFGEVAEPSWKPDHQSKLAGLCQGECCHADHLFLPPREEEGLAAVAPLALVSGRV